MPRENKVDTLLRQLDELGAAGVPVPVVGLTDHARSCGAGAGRDDPPRPHILVGGNLTLTAGSYSVRGAGAVADTLVWLVGYEAMRRAGTLQLWCRQANWHQDAIAALLRAAAD